MKPTFVVQIFALGDYLIMAPNKTRGRGFYPTTDSGRMGSVILDSKKNVQISKKALALINKMAHNHDSVGDFSWWPCTHGKYALSWWGGIFRAIHVPTAQASRDSNVYPDQCTIIPNRITKEMKDGVKKLDPKKGIWKEPFFVTREKRK